MAMQNALVDGMNNNSEGGSSLPPKKRPYQFPPEFQEKVSRQATNNFGDDNIHAISNKCKESLTMPEDELAFHNCKDSSTFGKAYIECKKLSASDNVIENQVIDDAAYHVNNAEYPALCGSELEAHTNNEFESDSTSTPYCAPNVSTELTKVITNTNSVMANAFDNILDRSLDSYTVTPRTSCTTPQVSLELESMLTKSSLHNTKNADVTAVDLSVSIDKSVQFDESKLPILQKTNSIESSPDVSKFVDIGRSDTDSSASVLPFTTSPVKQKTSPPTNILDNTHNIADDIGKNVIPSNPAHIPNNTPPVSLKQAKTSTVSDKLSDANETDSIASNTLNAFNPPVSQKKNPKADFDSKVPSIIDLTNDDNCENAGEEPVIDLTNDDDFDVVLEFVAKRLNFLPSQAEFLLKYAHDILQSNGVSKAVDIKLCENGIDISGSCQKVDKVAETLLRVSWYVEQLCYDCPKVSHHFQTDIWKDFIKVVKDAYRCSVIVDPGAPSELSSNNDSPSERSSNNLLDIRPVAIESNAITSHGPADSLRNWPSVDLMSYVTHSTMQTIKQTSYGDVEVMVCKGDITDDCSCAIVNGVSANFNFNSELSMAIVRKAGSQLVSDCHAMPLMEGCNQRLRVTHAYNLNCKYVIHLIIPKIQEYVAMIYGMLSYAEYHNITSIAIPAIGTESTHNGNSLRPRQIKQTNIFQCPCEFARNKRKLVK